jgi:hypothetical protein
MSKRRKRKVNDRRRAAIDDWRARGRDALERAVIGALRSAIHHHGPITMEWIGSAAKRVVGNLTNAARP